MEQRKNGVELRSAQRPRCNDIFSFSDFLTLFGETRPSTQTLTSHPKQSHNEHHHHRQEQRAGTTSPFSVTKTKVLKGKQIIENKQIMFCQICFCIHVSIVVRCIFTDCYLKSDDARNTVHASFSPTKAIF